MDHSFSFTHKPGPQHELVQLSGTIDADAETLFEAMQKQLCSNQVVFDFSGVGRVNSMGIALLLRCLKRLSSEKKVAVQLQGLSQMNAMLFKMSGVFLLAKEAR